jgi:hypothetical protein
LLGSSHSRVVLARMKAACAPSLRDVSRALPRTLKP